MHLTFSGQGGFRHCTICSSQVWSLRQPPLSKSQDGSQKAFPVWSSTLQEEPRSQINPVAEQGSGFLQVTDTGQGGIWQGFTRLSQIVPLGQPPLSKSQDGSQKALPVWSSTIHEEPRSQTTPMQGFIASAWKLLYWQGYQNYTIDYYFTWDTRHSYLYNYGEYLLVCEKMVQTSSD